MKLRNVVSFALVCSVMLAHGALAQEWGNLSTAQSLVDWLLGPVLLIVITLCLIGAIIYAVFERNIMVGVVSFAVICIIGGVVAFVPQIAQSITGGG